MIDLMVVVYSGSPDGALRRVAASAAPDVVKAASSAILAQPLPDDPVDREIELGYRRALGLRAASREAS